MSEGGTWTVRRILEWTGGFFERKNLEPAPLTLKVTSHTPGQTIPAGSVLRSAV
jgi:hypothetical protein